MTRRFHLSCLFGVVSLAAFMAGDPNADSKRILGRWSSSRSGADSIFHANGSWGVYRDHETIQGRWRLKGKKLFLTYPEDNGVGTPVHIRTAEYKITFVSNDRFTT